MLKDIKFSLPLYPGLSPSEIEGDIYPFLEECGDLISDIYFTSRIAPFNKDAMGGIIVNSEIGIVTKNALIISETFGIPLSGTFNDITISPSFNNYNIFINNFKPLYEAGIRRITIPNTSWLKFGLKNIFPDLFVKNTILNKVQTAAEVAKLFEAGFDYINLNRELMRDEKTLIEIKQVKEILSVKLGRPLFISLLYNESCEGYCDIHQDHYAYNLNRTIKDNAYFHSEMRNISPCKMSKVDTAIWNLKAANIPSFYSTLGKMSEYVDVFKMHGRESKVKLYESLSIITDFKRKKLIKDPYREIFDKIGVEHKKHWLKTIRNCKFNCWKCTVCDEIAEIFNS